jgi:hypothetical protein
MSSGVIDAATRAEADVATDPSAPVVAISLENGWPTATPGAPEATDTAGSDELVGAAVQGPETPF